MWCYFTESVLQITGCLFGSVVLEPVKYSIFLCMSFPYCILSVLSVCVTPGAFIPQHRYLSLCSQVFKYVGLCWSRPASEWLLGFPPLLWFLWVFLWTSNWNLSLLKEIFLSMGFPMIQGEELDGDLQFRLCFCIMSGSGSLYQSHMLTEEASLTALDKAPIFECSRIWGICGQGILYERRVYFS